MISWIVASHRPDVLAGNLAATLRLETGDELVVVEDPPSIAVAYNQGQAKAVNSLRVYVHSDVRILDAQTLRRRLLDCASGNVGMVGLVGSRTPALPWWSGDGCGSVLDGRLGAIDFGAGGPCAYLDGLLLATRQQVDWDESYPGFHWYDHDACQQMLSRGLRNRCLTGGTRLVLHNTGNSTDTSRLDGWDEGMARFRQKWSTP